MTSELLPCPFCGRQPKVDVKEASGFNSDVWCHISCDCRARPMISDSVPMQYWDSGKYVTCNTEEAARKKSLDRAIYYWNKRETTEWAPT